MRVTVVIPAYRATKTIGRAMDSVLAQTLAPDEILVIDDGSPDEIAPALAAYGDRVRLLRKPNGGAASARNFGIERAAGDLIAFLDADDHWEPGKLAAQVDVFRRHPEVGVCSTRFFVLTPGGEPSITRAVEERDVGRVLRPRGPAIFDVAMQLWTSVVMVRKSLLGERRFPTDLKTAEDRDLWVRLAAAAPVYLLGEPLATCVLEPGSLSRSGAAEEDCVNMLTVIRRHGGLLGRRGRRRQEAALYRRWAGALLVERKARAALRPACCRILREPLSPEGWWILLKTAGLALR